VTKQLRSRGLLVLLILLVCGSTAGAMAVIKQGRQPARVIQPTMHPMSPTLLVDEIRPNLSVGGDPSSCE
jgi:hypothetical protein